MMKKKRIWQLVKTGCLFFIIGMLYVYIIKNFGISIKCPFHSITGYNCPGCGITRMVLCLLSGNIKEAFYENMGLTLILPLLTFICIKNIYHYIKFGAITDTLYDKIMIISIILFLLFWGFIRNIYGV